MSPPKGNKRSAAHRDRCLSFIDEIIYENIDLIFFGEVTKSDMHMISELPNASDFEIYSIDERSGPLTFNIGIMYKPSKLTIFNHNFEIKIIAGSRYKIAISFEILALGTLELKTYVVHWPSRLHLSAGASKRDTIGHTLREHITSSMEAGQRHILVIGDFNEEPFDAPISEMLMATRDIKMAHRNPKLLYNPFWRFLVNSPTFETEGTGVQASGTYFFPSGKVDRWLTLDQMMFSSSFLGKGEWHLNEPETRVWYQPPIVEAVISRSELIDHLPIIGEIERRIAHDEL